MPAESFPGHTEYRQMDERLPNLAEIASWYDYKTPDAGVERSGLVIDWEKSDLASLHNAIVSFEAGLEVSPPIEAGEYTVDFDVCALKLQSGQDFIISPFKIAEVGLNGEIKKVLFQFIITNPEVPHDKVAEFNFLYEANGEREVWKLVHRLVSEAYRGQGIATGMLEGIEAGLIQREQKTNIPQEISVNIAQADVLLLFLKRGYTPATKADAERVKRFFAADKDLSLKSSPVLEDIGMSKHWYIFEKDSYPEEGSAEYAQLWHGSDENGEPNYLTQSFRITLKKDL